MIAEMGSHTIKSKSRRDEATIFAKSLLDKNIKSVVGGASTNADEGFEIANNKGVNNAGLKERTGDVKALSSGSALGSKGTTKTIKEVTGYENVFTSNDGAPSKNTLNL